MSARVDRVADHAVEQHQQQDRRGAEQPAERARRMPVGTRRRPLRAARRPPIGNTLVGKRDGHEDLVEWNGVWRISARPRASTGRLIRTTASTCVRRRRMHVSRMGRLVEHRRGRRVRRPPHESARTSGLTRWTSPFRPDALNLSAGHEAPAAGRQLSTVVGASLQPGGCARCSYSVFQLPPDGRNVRCVRSCAVVSNGSLHAHQDRLRHRVDGCDADGVDLSSARPSVATRRPPGPENLW